VIVSFATFFRRIKKNSKTASTPQDVKTCWDRWNDIVIMYFIVGIAAFVASYRFCYISAFDIWVLQNNPDFNELAIEQPVGF